MIYLLLKAQLNSRVTYRNLQKFYINKSHTWKFKLISLIKKFYWKHDYKVIKKLHVCVNLRNLLAEEFWAGIRPAPKKHLPLHPSGCCSQCLANGHVCKNEQWGTAGGWKVNGCLSTCRFAILTWMSKKENENIKKVNMRILNIWRLELEYLICYMYLRHL